MAGQELEAILQWVAQILERLFCVLDVALRLCATPHVEGICLKAFAGLQNEHAVHHEQL